jgi:signal transduction histidine kinase
MPGYLGLRFSIAGTELESNRGEELARATRPGTPAQSGTELSVLLTAPELLYAQQRARTRWFGALIGFSGLAMLCGLVAAWRAFQRQRELNEMKSNFVSSVSHELRAPIASVRLMAEELNEVAGADPEKSRSYHSFIVQECRRLSALLENVLDFSRHEQGRKEYQFEPTDLSALVQATTHLMRSYSSDKQIEIVAWIQESPTEIEADGRALQQALVNLIDNAIKHSPPASTITVGLDVVAASDPDSGAARARFASRFGRSLRRAANPAEAATVRLWVEDQGEGTPPGEHERIFERFYRSGSEMRRQTQGVGLGLAIVKHIAEAHHGRVTVRSAVGQGSRFTIELPVSTHFKREAPDL